MGCIPWKNIFCGKVGKKIVMTIQEYMRLAVNGIPSKDFHYYLPYFINMSCEHCVYNGRACSHPETDDVCIDYRVERKHKEREKSKRKQK